MVWLTQLGISVAAPLAGFVFLGVWLHGHLGFGSWTVWCGIILGLYSAISGLRGTLKLMEQMADRGKSPESQPIAFNDHT